jgi:deoxyribonuclease V
MKIAHAPSPCPTPAEAIALQRELSARIVLRDDIGEVQRIAGLDCGFEESGRVTRAAVAVLSYPGLTLLEHSLVRMPTAFPYIPGLLSFREAPALLAALEMLETPPDLLLADGQGYAHPRRFGIACHLGLLTGLPAIGVAKSRLIGVYEEPPNRRGAWTPLLDKNETIGAALRTRERVKPLYISAGHRVSLETAIAWTLRCAVRHRLPEPARAAHRLASG